MNYAQLSNFPQQKSENENHLDAIKVEHLKDTILWSRDNSLAICCKVAGSLAMVGVC